jgi:hypothetical protein
VQELEAGPVHRFQDWPNEHVPKRAAGVYTVWDSERLLYVGMSGRAMTATAPVGSGPLRRGRLRRSGPLPLTVCSARGWDREVERHQATRQRLLQLLEQLGASETR